MNIQKKNIPELAIEYANMLITELILKGCWHDWEQTDGMDAICKKCNKSNYDFKDRVYIPINTNRDFSKTTAYAELVEFCKKQLWWESFIEILDKEAAIDLLEPKTGMMKILAFYLMNIHFIEQLENKIKTLAEDEDEKDKEVK